VQEPTEEVIVNVQPAPLSASPWEVPVEAPHPYAHYLSNGRYGVMLTSAGSGYSQWNDRALTRWRADTTLDDWGTWLYIRDEETGNLWSAGYQPIGGTPERLSSTFYPHKAEFVRRDYDITSRLEIILPPDDDVEIRYLTLTNHGEESRRLMICSYSELVLAPQSNDQRHQAFNKMFIESDYLRDIQSLIFQRRLRSVHDEPFFVLHRLLLKDTPTLPQYETDRARFLGRNGTVHAPQALTGESTGLTGTVGATLDPIMALAHEVEIDPYETVQLVYLTIASDERSHVISQAHSFSVWAHINHAIDQARYRVERELHHIHLDTGTVQRIQALYSALLYPHHLFRAPAEVLAANTQAQPGLWTFGISGEYPIVLADVSHAEELGLIRELVQAHTFWRNRGIKSTLVVLNRHDSSYDQALYTQLRTLISRMHSEAWLNRHDGIFIIQNDQLSDANRILLQAAARVYLQGKLGMLHEQLALHSHQTINLPRFIPTLASSATADLESIPRALNLKFDNGYGGFTEHGHEYVVYVTSEQATPAPWTNVIANELGGFTITESGGGYSWAYNSGENRLTNWRNDPVTDMPGEAIYLRDEETGAVWSPTPAPANSGRPYCVRHGAGYTTIEHHCHDIKQTVRYYGALEDPVKFVRVSLKNASSRTRRITVTYYAEWVLGPTKDITQQYLIPSFDADTQTVLVSNPYSIEFGNYHAFLTANKSFHSFTTDRTEFLGRMGSYHSPTAFKRMSLSGAVVAGADSCAAVQLHIDLPVGGEEMVCFILGQGTDRVSALDMSRKYRDKNAIDSSWTATVRAWRTRLDSIVVRTPDEAMNIILPWLLYQSLACRIWGRSALYQSSGAYGFRDQLQDVMALVHSDPDIARKHILRAARHQFEAGDVLHWWHPPSGRGVRTRFADDLLWLPFVVAHYVYSTGDESVLHEHVPFLKGEPLRHDEEERYGFYESTDETFTIYEHCRRALEKGHTSGMNNLPLMQAGDWNDGMNRVGIEGRGESVWMAWFLLTTMQRFLPLCTIFNDDATAKTYQGKISALKNAVEQNAWDGNWYRRAYYDDGTPLGSAQNAECKIDSLTQSWAVLSGMAEPRRAKQAMKSVDEWLVKEEDQLIKLFTPPFNDTLHDPGYIKGYPPGIRENGGQYTHAALWVIWAFAEMGMGHRAEELFRLVNPIYHANTRVQADLYRVEPYVIAADVYGEPPHTGQGGWTWYTGSSGWMYRLGIEAILGLKREGAILHIDPKISRDWPQFEVDYRYGTSLYHIRVENPNHIESGVESVLLDEKRLPSNSVPLADDSREHKVIVIMRS
jgi:cyclic beta-1,2-glucan synthetase